MCFDAFFSKYNEQKVATFQPPSVKRSDFAPKKSKCVYFKNVCDEISVIF